MAAVLLQEFAGPVIPHDGIGPYRRRQIGDVGVADLAVIGMGDDAPVRENHVQPLRRGLQIDDFAVRVADEIICRRNVPA